MVTGNGDFNKFLRNVIIPLIPDLFLILFEKSASKAVGNELWAPMCVVAKAPTALTYLAGPVMEAHLIMIEVVTGCSEAL
jgi:hypothetical protein